MIYRWVKNILIGIDQLANAVLFGDPDETISSRVGKLCTIGKLKWLGAAIDFVFGKNHVLNSIESDEGKDSVILK